MAKRGSGILLHITSLPSPFGIGDLGPEAYRFADFLAETKQNYWQVLPLNQTDLMCGSCPYSSISAFAGNALLISPELLVKSGFLAEADVTGGPSFPRERCDYASVTPYKIGLLHAAYDRFKTSGIEAHDYEEFCSRNAGWLDDFALFSVIKSRQGGKAWGEWPPGLRDREPGSLEEITKRFRDQIEREKFVQYLFFHQWFLLREYCNQNGIALIGDIPIYVSYDSADVWCHVDLFKLDEARRPTFVAGVPPDYFSKTGQLWGNPIFRWDVLKQSGFSWWFQRVAHNFHLFDLVRIDHFRGFVGFWEVAATELTAINGHWVEAPAVDFFEALLERFPTIALIAEDLGLITPDVKEVMHRFGFPGMRILLFAFNEDLPTHPYLPHNYAHDCVIYTGTHDNNTALGWFETEASPEDRKRLFRYLGREVLAGQVPRELIRLAMMSIADRVIIPMQDLLGLGQEARMNRPSTVTGNWEWRLLPEQITSSHAAILLDMTRTYGRA